MRVPRLFVWLRQAWPGREREIKRQWSAAAEVAPLALADLAAFCGADRDTHVPDDPHTSIYNAGKRAVWLHVQRQLADDMPRLDAILNEAAEASEDVEGLMI